jgi:hypothetical protein
MRNRQQPLHNPTAPANGQTELYKRLPPGLISLRTLASTAAFILKMQNIQTKE